MRRTLLLHLLLCLSVCNVVSSAKKKAWRTRLSKTLQSSESDPCQASAADIVFVLDGSSSILLVNFPKLINFIKDLVKEFPDETQVALVQFSADPQTEFFLNSHEKRSKLQKAISQVSYKTGVTNIGLALEHVRSEVLTEEHGDRKDVPNIVIVLTDGRSQDDPGYQASRLRAEGSVLIAVGVTNHVDDAQLFDITGNVSRVFKVAEFEDLNAQLGDTITKSQLCQITTEPPVETTTIDPVTRPTFPLGSDDVEVTCNLDSIHIAAKAKSSFHGHIYVKGHFSKTECKESGQGSTDLSFDISLAECDAVRRRSINPPGVFMETTVILKHHPKFLTKADRAYKVQCFYMSAEKTLTHQLAVSMIPTDDTLEHSLQMPVCSYTVRRRTENGALLRFAVVGEPAVHIWKCESEIGASFFQMTVYNCKISSSKDEHVLIIDEDGCSVDPDLIPDLEYDEKGMRAVSKANIFKFADQPAVRFQCQIALCFNGDNTCLTKRRNCFDRRQQKVVRTQKKRSIDEDVVNATEALIMDVESNDMHVLDPNTDGSEDTELIENSEKEEDPDLTFYYHNYAPSTPSEPLVMGQSEDSSQMSLPALSSRITFHQKSICFGRRELYVYMTSLILIPILIIVVILFLFYKCLSVYWYKSKKPQL